MAENDQLAGTLVANPTDPSVVQGLLADPRFQKLNSAQKRQLLSDADPIFADPETFNDAAIEKFASTKPRQQSIDEAMAKSLQKNKGAGKFPEVSPISAGRRILQLAVPPLALYDAMTGKDPGAEALAQGGLETILAGTPEAIAARSGIPINERTSAKFTNPYEYAFGETLGGLVPLGRLGKVATAGKQSLSALIKEGMRLGAVYGGAGGIASEAKEEDPTFSDAATKGIIGTAFGTAIGAGIPLTVAAGSALNKKISTLVQERISEFNKAMKESTEDVAKKLQAKEDLKNSLANEIEQLVLREKEANRKLSGLEEAESAAQMLSQEELARLQQEAQARGREARTVILENQPRISEREAALEASAGVPRSITEALPVAPEPSELGGKTAASIAREEKLATKPVNDAYAAIKESIPKENPPSVSGSNFLENAGKHLQEETSGLPLSDDVKRTLSSIVEGRKTNVSPEIQRNYDEAVRTGNKRYIQVLEERYPEIKSGKGYTWENMQRIFRDLTEKTSKAYRQGDKDAVRIYGELKKSLNEDMQQYADEVGGETKALFDKAKAMFIAKEEKFGKQVAPFLSEEARKNPETLVNEIISTKGVSQVNRLKNILPPQEFALIQSAYAERLFSPEKGVAFDPAHFLSEYNKHSDEVKRAVFGEQGFKGLKSLYEAHQGVASIEKMNTAINRVSKLADDAERAFQGAKTPSDERRIKAGIIEEMKKEVDELVKQRNYLKSSDKQTANTREFEKHDEVIAKAMEALERKKNPLKQSDVAKLTTTAAILTTAFYSNNNEIGIVLALINQFGKERFARAFVSPKFLAGLEKATSVRLTDAQRAEAVRQLSRTIIESSELQIRNQDMNSLEKSLSETIQKSIDEQVANSIAK